MPIGCFLVEIDSESKAKIKKTFFEDSDEILTLEDSLILQIRMGLSENRLYIHMTNAYSIVSYLSDFRRNKERLNLITGVILKISDDPNNFRESIKMVSEIFTSDPEFSIEEAYREYFETPSIILSQNELEMRLKNRVKKLNKEGKFDEAKKLLDIIKKVPKKLFQANKAGEKALKEKNYERAQIEFLKAVKFADQLKEEKELADSLKEKVKIVKQIPKLNENREKIIEMGKKALKNDKIEEAYVHFREAGELSKKLLDLQGAEEYRLKADALAKYYEIHKKYHK